jgi:methylenetetrahydrofolate reductase (NADPH)
MTFQEALASGVKVITAEVTPPHGTDINHFMNTAELLKPYVHAFNITDNQRALMRMSGLACAGLLVRRGMDPIWQLTCRDRNLLALQSDILGANALGVRNVLALTGDPVGAGDTGSAKGVFQFEAVGLLNLLQKLNSGVDVNDKTLNGKSNLCAGAVVNPAARAVDLQIKRLEKKLKAGAKFFQTQAVFSCQQMDDFMSKVRPTGAKIIAGVLLVRTLKTALFLKEKVPGVYVPDDLIALLQKSKNPEEEGIDFAAKLVKHYMEICDGVHLMAIRSEEKLVHVLNRAGVSKA